MELRDFGFTQLLDEELSAADYLTKGELKANRTNPKPKARFVSLQRKQRSKTQAYDSSPLW